MKKIPVFLLTLAHSLIVSGCVGIHAKRIVLDVGHSRAHPGATSAYGKPEFDFNAELSAFVNLELQNRGVSVVVIGADGNINQLVQRTQLANTHRADFMLSIHHDSVQAQFLKPWKDKRLTKYYSSHAAGFSLFVSRKNPSWPTGLRCAGTIGLALRQRGFQPTSHHAENIAGEHRPWADKANGVYYFDELKVLKTANMPAVLLEAGVIVNPVEEQQLLTSAYRSKIAEAVGLGLTECGMIK